MLNGLRALIGSRGLVFIFSLVRIFIIEWLFFVKKWKQSRKNAAYIKDKSSFVSNLRPG